MNILKWKGLDIDPMKIHESVTTKASVSQIDTSFNESTNESGLTVLYPKIEAIHEGRTRNYNRYPAEKLKGNHELRSGVYSWTQPYPKPVIFNHDQETECTGRVYSASFSEITSVGRPGIFVTPKITHEKTIKDILDGRLLTVSIGASTNAAICSICHTDIINEGYCGHMRGNEYDGEMAEWICGDLFFDELSWVNVPADSDAMVIATNTNYNTMASQESIEVKTPVDAPKNEDSNTMLTTESVVVKNISESSETEKEDNVVTDTEKVVEETTTEDTATVVEEKEEIEEVTAVNDIVEESTETEAQEEVEVEAETTVEESTETVVEEETEATPSVDEELATAKEELATTKAALAEAESSVEELKAANIELAKELRETVVNFLVDLRLAIGKESSKEEAVEKFAARSLESLRDSISDILAEKPALNTARTVEKVVKPVGKAITESKTLATEEAKVISNADVFYKLLKGNQ